jgi:hypothetical protein
LWRYPHRVPAKHKSNRAWTAAPPDEGDARDDAAPEVDHLVGLDAQVVPVLLVLAPHVEESPVAVVALGQAESASDRAEGLYLDVGLVENRANA